MEKINLPLFCVVKVKPDGYQLGHGTGFVAGEEYPGISK